MQPGDLLLTERHGPMSRAIGFGSRRKFKGERRKYAWPTHAAICVSPHGEIVEALGRGVTLSDSSKYDDVRHAWVTIGCYDSWTRERVTRFAKHQLGRSYGFTENLSLALWMLSGTHLRFGIDNQMICSASAAEALTRTDAIFPQEPLWMLPAHLAEYYDVEAP